MCRGRNGSHVRLCAGVSYCASGRTLHIVLELAADVVGGDASDASVRPLWVVGKVTRLVERQRPEWDVGYIVLGRKARKGDACGKRPD
jgi:hypothetical protein